MVQIKLERGQKCSNKILILNQVGYSYRSTHWPMDPEILKYAKIQLCEDSVIQYYPIMPMFTSLFGTEIFLQFISFQKLFHQKSPNIHFAFHFISKFREGQVIVFSSFAFNSRADPQQLDPQITYFFFIHRSCFIQFSKVLQSSPIF